MCDVEAQKEISNDSDNVSIGGYILVYAKTGRALYVLEPLSKGYIREIYEPTEQFPEEMARCR